MLTKTAHPAHLLQRSVKPVANDVHRRLAHFTRAAKAVDWEKTGDINA